MEIFPPNPPPPPPVGHSLPPAPKRSSELRITILVVIAVGTLYVDFFGGRWLPTPEGTGVIPHPGIFVFLLSFVVVFVSPLVGLGFRLAFKDWSSHPMLEGTLTAFIGLSALMWFWVLTSWDL